MQDVGCINIYDKGPTEENLPMASVRMQAPPFASRVPVRKTHQVGAVGWRYLLGLQVLPDDGVEELVALHFVPVFRVAQAQCPVLLQQLHHAGKAKARLWAAHT